MATKTIYTRVQNKHDTEANWNKATNFIPLQGELIVYDPDSTNLHPRIKVGDGVTKVSQLDYAFYSKSEVDTLLSKYKLLPTYHNLVDMGSSDWREAYRLGNNASLTAQAGAVVTNYIPCNGGNFDVIRVQGMGNLLTYYTAIYNSSQTRLACTTLSGISSSYLTYSYDSAKNVVTIWVVNSNVRYIRFSGIRTGEIVITVNEEIK